MSIRKWVALAATASVAFWTPSIVPVKASVCGVGEYQTVDTAYAVEPCPVGAGHASSPWPAVVVIVGVVGVITNAAWVWHTQCRELTSQEAMTSTFLPFIGMAFDAQASKCH
jgi:hypothetical protein